MPRIKIEAKPSRVVVSSLLALVLLTSYACRGSGTGGGAGGVANNNNSGNPPGEVHSTPPYPTKEPERYRATMVVTFSADAGQTAQDKQTQTFIARDGDRRREDYEFGPGTKVSELETPAGHFLLLPDKKLYAEIKRGMSGVVSPSARADAPAEFSPDRLINESPPEARYEKLGAEELNGRATTKYRVTALLREGADKSFVVENLVWVDESLGMPVRSETTSTEGDRRTRYTMEMRELSGEVDAQTFQLPAGFRRVEPKELFARILQK